MRFGCGRHAKPMGQGGRLDRAAAEALVRDGDFSVAVVLPKGLGQSRRFWSEPGASSPRVQVLADVSDPIAPQIVQGLLQKVSFTAAPESMATEGLAMFEKYSGPLTPEQRASVDQWVSSMRQKRDRPGWSVRRIGDGAVRTADRSRQRHAARRRRHCDDFVLCRRHRRDVPAVLVRRRRRVADRRRGERHARTPDWLAGRHVRCTRRQVRLHRPDGHPAAHGDVHLGRAGIRVAALVAPARVFRDVDGHRCSRGGVRPRARNSSAGRGRSSPASRRLSSSRCRRSAAACSRGS